LNLTYNVDTHISSTSQTYQQYLWLKSNIVSVIRDRFIAKANDCDDSAEACRFNGDHNSARIWRERRDAWRAKAAEQWKDEPSMAQLQRLIEIEKRQYYISNECQIAGNGLDEALRLEKPKQEARCREQLAKHQAEATKLAKDWREGMHTLRIPIMGDEAEMRLLGWWEPHQAALKARRG
jgi:hypothetical protein